MLIAERRCGRGRKCAVINVGGGGAFSRANLDRVKPVGNVLTSLKGSVLTPALYLLLIFNIQPECGKEVLLRLGRIVCRE